MVEVHVLIAEGEEEDIKKEVVCGVYSSEAEANLNADALVQSDFDFWLEGATPEQCEILFRDYKPPKFKIEKFILDE